MGGPAAAEPRADRRGGLRFGRAPGRVGRHPPRHRSGPGPPGHGSVRLRRPAPLQSSLLYRAAAGRARHRDGSRAPEERSATCAGSPGGRLRVPHPRGDRGGDAAVASRASCRRRDLGLERGGPDAVQRGGRAALRGGPDRAGARALGARGRRARAGSMGADGSVRSGGSPPGGCGRRGAGRHRGAAAAGQRPAVAGAVCSR